MLTISIKLLIRFATYAFCQNYIFHRLLHIKEKKKQTIPAQILTTLITLVLAIALPPELQYFVYPVFLVLSFIFATCITRLDAEMIFTAVIFSYGIVFGTYALSTFVPLFVIVAPLYAFFQIRITNVIILQLIISPIQILCCVLLFRIKRLQSGMPFLQNKLLSKIGVFTGTLIIFCFTVLSTLHTKMANTIVNYYLLIFAFVIIAILFLFIWWKNQIQRNYDDKRKEREFTQLKQQLIGCEQQLFALKEENQALSKLIHRDNKQIPAMQLAVHEFMELANDVLFSNSETAEYPVLREKGAALLTQLEKEMEERNQRIRFHSQSVKQLIPTNVTAIDQLLSFMLHHGISEGIDFDFTLNGNINYMLQEVVDEADCVTLLGDLLENAMLATKANHGKHMLLHIGVIDQTYTIDVWDSGAPFPKAVLFYLGKKRYTTRKKQGGSGIGLMSTYELAQKYHASLVIDERIENIYTKKVSIVFDGKQQYRLVTSRDANEMRYLSQRKDCVINAERNIHLQI